MDREHTEEAREDERAALHARLRARSLADAVREGMHGGDRLTIGCGAGRWTGVATGSSGDHVELATASSRIVANLGGPISIDREPSNAGGTTGDRGHRSLRARLSTVSLSGDLVEAVTPSRTARGRLAVVAVDHVIVEADGVDTWIPLHELGVVVLPTAG